MGLFIDLYFIIIIYILYFIHCNSFIFITSVCNFNLSFTIYLWWSCTVMMELYCEWLFLPPLRNQCLLTWQPSLRSTTLRQQLWMATSSYAGVLHLRPSMATWSTTHTMVISSSIWRPKTPVCICLVSHMAVHVACPSMGAKNPTEIGLFVQHRTQH